MKRTNTNQVKSPQFKDISRFTRWISRLDEQDENLSPVKRKTKWMFFLGVLFLAFALSFILFPSAKFSHESMESPMSGAEQPARHTPPTSPFEMPTDSFENLLKRQIDENNLHLSEKK